MSVRRRESDGMSSLKRIAVLHVAGKEQQNLVNGGWHGVRRLLWNSDCSGIQLNSNRQPDQFGVHSVSALAKYAESG